MYGLYSLGLLAGILLWVAMDHMDKKLEDNKDGSAKTPADPGTP
ncbi:MAG: hypothetical protein OEZ41_06940 [Nitrospirota bacterium]|nr:hypothetical protein [Nitrospirota bacterium]